MQYLVNVKVYSIHLISSPSSFDLLDTFCESRSIRNDDGVSSTSTHFLSSNAHQLSVLVVQDDEDDGCSLLDESEGAVLECSTTVSLRMQVGDFFNLRKCEDVYLSFLGSEEYLKSTFVGDWFRESLAKDEAVVRTLELLGNVSALVAAT